MLFLFSRTFQRIFQKTLPAPSLAKCQSSFVLAEHDNGRLSPLTLYAITTASQLGGEVSCLVGGTSCRHAAKELVAVPGVSEVLLADHAADKDFPPRQLAAAMISAQQEFKFSHIIAHATTFSHPIMYSVAAELEVPVIPNIVLVKDKDTFLRLDCDSDDILLVKSVAPVKMMTVLLAKATYSTENSSESTCKKELWELLEKGVDMRVYRHF